MKSQWSELKTRAISLRKRGLSIRRIEALTNIPRSTLSGWFRSVVLNERQRLVLDAHWRQALSVARVKAVRWHNAQKANRLKLAEEQARDLVSSVGNIEEDLIEIAFAVLYWGEGFKTNSQTGMGNSDPLLLRFFVCVLRKVYKVELSNIKCELHIRADQDPLKIKEYWSVQLGIPSSHFTSVSIDKRTSGSATYQSYKGVCVVRCGHVAIQRKTMNIAKLFAEQVIRNYAGA